MWIWIILSPMLLYMLCVIILFIDEGIDRMRHPKKYLPEQYKGKNRYEFVGEGGYMMCETTHWDRKKKKYITN